MQLHLQHLAGGCLAALLVACGGGGGGPEGDPGAGTSSGSASNVLPVGSDPAAPASSTSTLCAGLPSSNGSLASRIANAPISKSESGNYRPATEAEQATFRTGFLAILRGDPLGLPTLRGLGFTASCFSDGDGTRWLLLEDATPGRAGGRYAVNLAPARELWFEAPHPASDLNTEYQAVELAAQLGARAVLVSGSHRCTSPTPTSCSGSSSPCGTIRISDVAHAADNFFTVAHSALREVFSGALAVSVHGMTPLAGEAAVVSDGTPEARPTSISVRTRDAINAELTSTSRVKSCNDPLDTDYRKLCGFTNVQGRIDNGSPNACTVDAARASDRFVHLEQGPALRGTSSETGVNPQAVVRAFAALVPCSAAGAGLGCGKR